MESAYNKITVTRDKVQVTRIFKSKYQKEGRLTAELKQTVHSTIMYPPKKSVANAISIDNPFLEQGKGKSFTRSKTFVAFLDIDENTTLEEAQHIIDVHEENPTIFKIISNFPILSDSQKLYLNSIEDKQERQAKYDLIANRQLFVKKGEIILDNNGKPQFIECFYSSTFKDNIDLRTSLPLEYYSNKYVETHLKFRELNRKNIIL